MVEESTIEAQERAFNQSLAGLFGQYATCILLTEVESKMKYLEFIKTWERGWRHVQLIIHL